MFHYYDNIYYKIGFVILILLCILLFIYIITRFTINKMYESAQEMYYKTFVPKNEYKQYLREKRKIAKQHEERLEELRRNHDIAASPDMDEKIVGIIKPTGPNAAKTMKEKYEQLIAMNEAIKANQGGIKNRWQTETTSAKKQNRGRGQGMSR